MSDLIKSGIYLRSDHPGWLDAIIAEQQRQNGPLLTRLIDEVADLNDRLSPEELDELERSVMRQRREEEDRAQGDG